MKKVGKIVVLDSIPPPSSSQVIRPQPRVGAIDLSVSVQEEDQAIEKLPNLPLPKSIEDRLFPHQKYGVNWMYRLHLNGVGGLLGDEM